MKPTQMGYFIPPVKKKNLEFSRKNKIPFLNIYICSEGFASYENALMIEPLYIFRCCICFV